MIVQFYKALRKIYSILKQPLYSPLAKIVFFLNGVNFADNLKVYGTIKVHVTRRGKVHIGNNFSINSGGKFNIIGRQQKNTFWIEGQLIIGNNVGMSSTAIVCKHDIEIGDNVTIGGNTVIYDTDFHAIDSAVRTNKLQDGQHAKWGKVKINNNVFIGAHTSILKGVTIGENAIIGACSVVTKNIPANEMWAGNPAKFIRTINTN